MKLHINMKYHGDHIKMVIDKHYDKDEVGVIRDKSGDPITMHTLLCDIVLHETLPPGIVNGQSNPILTYQFRKMVFGMIPYVREYKEATIHLEELVDGDNTEES